MTKQQKYDFKVVESEQSRALLSVNHFHSNPTKSILMPPPNITGNLHIGHSLDLVIQDFIVRSWSLKGEKVNWISGLDHAGIATQSKLELSGLLDPKASRTEKNKFVITEWYPQQKQKMAEQWANLGLFLDYQQSNFTMNFPVQQQVKGFFTTLYNDGLIRQSNRLVNWDTKLQTAVADIEVDSVNCEGVLYYIKYLLSESDNQYLEVATSRPETIFADVALFINPEDSRYVKHLGTWVKNPLTNKQIQIFASEKVKIDFGTGVLKCTPSHDFDDYELAVFHQLPILECYDKNGIFNSSAGQWEGKNARASRAEIVQDLVDRKLCTRVENYQTKVNISQRSGSVIEPLVSLQWFLDLPALVNKVEAANPKFLDQISFLPDDTKHKLLVWRANLKEWCISRQLWWGHQIPILHETTSSRKKIAETALPQDGWQQDPDVLDTWFSSSLWPLIVSAEQDHFTSIDYLVTGSDLLFFWLFKMIVFGFYFHQTPPFKNVVIHGLIKDRHGKKMSKSIGNGVEPEMIIAKYGADSLRLFLLSNNNYGSDLKFDEDKLKGCYFFLQKLWSISNFISSNSFFRELAHELVWSELELKVRNDNDPFNRTINTWIINELASIEQSYTAIISEGNNRLDTALVAKQLIEFTKEKVSSSYIYLVKNSPNQLNIEVLCYVLQRLLLMLNPLVPFLSGYLYKKMFACQPRLLHPVSYQTVISGNPIEVVDLLFSLRTKVSSLCKKNKIASSQVQFSLRLVRSWDDRTELVNLFLAKLAQNDKIMITISEVDQQLTTNELLDVSPYGTLHFSLTDHEVTSNGEAKSLQFYDHEIKRSLSLLRNPGFLSKSPRELVALEEKKFRNYSEQREKVLAEINNKKRKD